MSIHDIEIYLLTEIAWKIFVSFDKNAHFPSQWKVDIAVYTPSVSFLDKSSEPWVMYSLGFKRKQKETEIRK